MIRRVERYHLFPRTTEHLATFKDTDSVSRLVIIANQSSVFQTEYTQFVLIYARTKVAKCSVVREKVRWKRRLEGAG
jgi:hypothetical protein